ncbi:MAB_1171c family putative transporter [Streptomyces longwoodensis]|uniref:MAB_1171c family putative transporter n=1 Tax=Streptomyces longwoodensis TaxID=68231 RepID=UPI0033A6CA06
MNGLINYLSCGLLWLGLIVRAPDLVRHRHDPYLRAICAVLGLAGACFFLGAPPTVGAVNHLSGTPNLAAPLTYASITAYSAASQVLIVYWRGGPHVHRVTRRWIVTYAFVLLGIAVTFGLGDAPVERRTDFDTYYATTPFVAEMIVLYLVGHLAAVAVTTVSALRWARQVDGWLRAGLVTLGVGTLCNAGYSISKLVAVVARWCGRDWSALGTTISPVAAGLGAFVTVTGVLIPLAGPRAAACLRALRTYGRLEPLERELDELLTRRALRLPRPRWASPGTRLVWRQTSIHNALGHLDALFDRALYDRTHEAVLRDTGDPERAEATAWAAVVAAAVREERERAGGPERPVPVPDVTDLLQDRTPDPALLVRVAAALTTSPYVTAARLAPRGTAASGTA